MKKMLALLLVAIMLLSVAVPAWAADGMTAQAKVVTVSIDGKETDLTAYTINDETVLCLRDVALILSGTGNQFDTLWDGQARAVKLLSGKAYTVTGGELGSLPSGDKKYTVSTSPVYLDNRRIELQLYNVVQTNYVCLTELASLVSLHFTAVPNGYTVDTKKEHAENIDYSEPGHWVRFTEKPDKSVDVFFVYPTVWSSPDPGNQWNAPIDAPGMLAGAQSYLYHTAGVFEDCNVFAPYYRQVDAMSALSMTQEQRVGLEVMEDAAQDVIDAFDYYIKNLNGGRPFVIAGHSQGSSMLMYLLSDYFKAHPEVQKQMVAAYLTGYSITERYLADNLHLKFAESATDTGVIISWNTQADPADVPGLVNPVLEPGAIAINPLNWKRDGTYASVSENLGSLKANPDGSYSVIPGIADARVDTKLGVVICKSVNPEEHKLPTPVFPVGSYHGGDVDFYYCNLQQNVKDRVAAYMAKEQQLKLSDIDYSDKSHWYAYEDKGMDVDIFFLYPTVPFMDANGNPYDIDYAPIDNSGMLKAATAWLGRAECATTEGNVYAPLYRQLYFGKLATIASDEFEGYTHATPREDAFAAFDYFLTHINKNERPFILVGHSQGASLLVECATLMLGNEKYAKYNKNHIATYAIGYSVTQAQISRNSALKFASSPTDTGVIISWNTTSPSEVKSEAYKNFGTWNKDALTINPITWTTDETTAPASANLASKMFNIPAGTSEVFENYADATVNNTAKVLVCASVDESKYASTMSTIGRYHTDDMGLYYESIRKNIKDRISAFESK